MLRVAVFSPDNALFESLDAFEGFETVVIRPAEAFARVTADVCLIDVRAGHEIAEATAERLIASLAHRGNRTLVLIDDRADAQCLRLLEAGADDCVSSRTPAELAARIRSLARRSDGRPEDDGQYVGGGIAISRSRHEVRRDGVLVELTPTEFRVLGALAARPNEVVAHSTLADDVWGGGASARQQVRVHIRHLRQKLEADPAHPRIILTDHGRGYALRAG